MRPVCNPAVAAWFDYPTEGEDWQPRVQRAIALCSGCPLAAQCLDTATRQRETGVWGGRLLLNGRAIHGSQLLEDEDDLRAAHAAWCRGIRTDWARDGERAYQRVKKRAQYRRKREQRSAA